VGRCVAVSAPPHHRAAGVALPPKAALLPALAAKPDPFVPLASHTMIVPSHCNATPAKTRTRAVQGRGRYARTRRRSRIPTPTRSGAAGNGACTCDVVRRRFMGRTPLKTAPRRIPTEGVRFRASPSGFRPRPLVPGLFWFRARVILLTDGPTRPTQRLPVRRKVPTFPHPEPPLLLVVLGVAPSAIDRHTLTRIHNT